MNHRMPSLPVHHHLSEFTQTHVHQVSDAIQPSHPLSSPFPPAPNPQIGLICLVPDLTGNTLFFIIKYDVRYGFVINGLYYVEIVVVVQSLSHV